MDVTFGILAYLQMHKNLIAECMRDGYFLVALRIFSGASDAYHAYHTGKSAYHTEPVPKRGSVAYNKVESLWANICSQMSLFTIQHLSAPPPNTSMPFGDAPEGSHRLTRRQLVLLDQALFFALVLAHNSLRFPGITDVQRCMGHYYRALARASYGDFMMVLLATVFERECPACLASTYDSSPTLRLYYRRAADDIFYAIQLAKDARPALPQHLVNKRCTLHTEICAKIGHSAHAHYTYMVANCLARENIPALGRWEGDRALLE